MPELVLDISTPSGSEADATAMSASTLRHSAAINDVLGAVAGLPPVGTSASDQDVYVGSAAGLVRIWIPLPGASAAQLGIARRAVVGARRFGLLPVVSATFDERGCSALLKTPQKDRLCDSDTQEVLVLGTALPVHPIKEAYGVQDRTPTATITFADRDAAVLAAYTKAHVGGRVAITDGLVLVIAPTINQPITGKGLQISGSYIPAQMHAIVGKLQLAADSVTIRSGG